MSVKQRRYSAEFKTKVILDLISGDLTLGQICSKYQVSDKSVMGWKKKFMANASLAFDIDRTKSDYQAEIYDQKKQVSELHRQLGKRTAELEWASKKLKSLDFNQKKQMIKSERHRDLSVLKRCQLLGFHRSNYYYVASEGPSDQQDLLKAIDRIYSQSPFYGYRKMHQQLITEGYPVGINRVNTYMKDLCLYAIYPRKKHLTTLTNKQHKKYPYLLKDLEITFANQVWSTDITYIKINGGLVYLAAIIDWYAKAILAWKLSNTMDETLVMDTLNRALQDYGKPKVFNTDQGSQYTSRAHTKRLLELDIQISMDGKGRASDNIAIERFWRSVKYEDIYLHGYSHLRELKQGIKQYIDFYNYQRPHQTLAYRKPMDVYIESLTGGAKKVA